MFGNHLPESIARGEGWHSFKHQGAGADSERAIDNIGVTGHPADVSGTPVGFTLAIVKHILHRHGRLKQVAARRMQYALGFTGRSRGIKNEQRVLTVHPFGFAVIVDGLQGLVVPNIAGCLPRNVTAGSLYDQDGVDAIDGFERGIDVVFEGHRLTATHTLVGSNHEPASRIIDAIFQCLGGKAAEYH